MTYDFDSVPYHDIDFSKLTPTPEYENQEYEEQEADITGLVLSAEKIELEEDTSFQLNVIILPNEAGAQTVSWSSSDKSIVYMDGYGLVRGVSPGTATVTAASSDGKVTASCEVTVTKRADAEHVALDDLSEEAKVFAENNPNAIMKDFSSIDNDMDKAVEDGYYEFDGDGYCVTDLWQERYDKYTEDANKAIGVRTEILNKLAEEKRSFVLLIYTKDCEGRTYHATEGAERVLKECGIPYFYTNDMVSEFDRSLYDSVLDYQKAVQSSIVIFKDGEIYAGLNPDVDAIKSDEEVKNWLGKYIDIE